MWRWRVLGTALVLISCGGGAEIGRTDVADPISVIRVIDGDSLLVDTGAGELEVRLSGVNAPDRGECHHEEAREQLSSLLDGVLLTMAVEGTDQFGRTLARLQVDGADIAVELVEGGHGLAVVSVDNRDDLIEAEEAAYGAELGMWGPRCRSSRPYPVQFDPGASSVDPPGADDGRLHAEMVTLVNWGELTVDLGGWSLRDGSSLHRFSFAAATTLAPGERLEVASSSPGWDPGGQPVWSNGGDIALLLDEWGGLVARWRYRPPVG